MQLIQTTRGRQQVTRTRGFTLVELLVVIAIIGILIGLVFTAGNAVIGGSKERTTRDVIRTLDSAMQVYLEERLQDRAIKLPVFLAVNPANLESGAATYAQELQRAYVIVDGRAGEDSTGVIIDSTGLWLADARKNARVKEILDKIPPRLLVRWDPYQGTTPPAGPDALPQLDTVVDAWGRPIRLVLPQMDGFALDDPRYAQNQGRGVDAALLIGGRATLAPGQTFKPTSVRRNWLDYDAASSRVLTDSDGGRCATSRPYFYSMGEDAQVGMKRTSGGWVDHNADNVYTERPKLPRKPNP